jgi:hypothetical protein
MRFVIALEAAPAVPASRCRTDAILSGRTSAMTHQPNRSGALLATWTFEEESKEQ